MGRVSVVGSTNVDHVVRVPHLPAPGETVLGRTRERHSGTKRALLVDWGAWGDDATEQAILRAMATGLIDYYVVKPWRSPRLSVARAIRLSSASTTVPHSRQIRKSTARRPNLWREHLDLKRVAPIADIDVAGFVRRDIVRRHEVVVNRGRHGLRLGINRHDFAVADAQPDVVLAVLEAPMPAVVAAARAARETGARMILNAAPAQPLPDELLAEHPLVIVNVDELGVAGPAAANLLQRGAEAVIVTRGAEGITIVTPGEEVSIAAERAGSVLDATGAGDAFSGAVAAFLAEGLQLEAAARKANVAAGLSVLRPGARGGMPTRAELEGYLKQSPSV